MISPHNEWYIGNVLVCAHVSSKLAILFKTSFNKPDVDIFPMQTNLLNKSFLPRLIYPKVT